VDAPATEDEVEGLATEPAGGGRAAESDRILVLAPFRRDAALLCRVLAASGFAPLPCADAEDALRQLEAGGVAVVVLSQEALAPAVLDALRGHLEAQPAWSELPLVLLLDGAQHTGRSLDRLQALLPRAKLTLLQRPVRAVELLAAVRVGAVARRRQFQLRDHIALQAELQRELHHRVKNVLANVAAVYRLTRRQSGSLDAFAAAFEGRLTALSRVHGALIEAGPRPQGLRALAALTLAPYRAADGSAERVALEGPDLMLQPHASVILALALHELATNAAKYGALSAPGGTLSLRWSLEPEQTGGGRVLRLRWQETGGPPVRPPTRSGYGSAFIRSGFRHGWKGGAVFDFQPEGLVCEISGSAEAVLADTTGPAAPDDRPADRPAGGAGPPPGGRD
jgi:two-component sensor histidine kinase